MKINVKLEAELEAMAGGLNAHERVMLGRKYFRWARQLFISAQILRGSGSAKPGPTLPKCSPRKAALN